MAFNPQNFGLGFGAGVLTTVVGLQGWRAYQRWRDTHADMEAIMERREAQRSDGRSHRPYALRVRERRYVNDIERLAQSSHLMGARQPLVDILVEPRFIRLDPLVRDPDADEDEPSIFEAIPRVPDYPALHAPYNLPTIGIEDLGQGERAVVLLGDAGSGRTTALMSIALWSMGQVQFNPLPDIVMQRIEAEESKLSQKERADRIKRNLEAATKARERFRRLRAQSRGETVEEETDLDDDENRTTLPFLRQQVPIYIHLNNVRVRQGGFGNRIDPAEPLIRAAQTQVRWYTRKQSPRGLYRLLTTGRALVLIDGLDDVPEAERAEKWTWLAAFMAQYRENMVVLAAPTIGYQRSLDLGFVPVYLRPWTDPTIAEEAALWGQTWPTLSGLSQTPTQSDIEMMQHTNRARSPFEISVRLLSRYAHQEEDHPTAHMAYYLENRFSKIATTQGQWPALAALQLDEGFITAKRLVEIAASEQNLARAASALPQTTASQDDEFLAALDSDDEKEPASVEAPAKADKQTEKRLQQIRQEIHRLLDQLAAAGLLTRYAGWRYQFRHSQIAAYLAGLWLKDVNDITLVARAQQPAWAEALAFASYHRPMDHAVRILTQPPFDILQTRLLSLTRWLRVSGKRLPWRGKLLQYLGSQFVAPHQYYLLRERIAAALVNSLDDGALTIFRRALDDASPDVLALATLSLGALRDTGAIERLKGFIHQTDPRLQISSTLALGAIGSEEALLALADELEASKSSDVRRAVAETFAGIPTEGYPTLYEAVRTMGKENDLIFLRRAAVFGLGRVQTPWSLIVLNEVLLNPDEDFAVQSAAVYVLENVYLQSRQGLHKYPAPAAVPWLSNWTSRQSQVGSLPANLGGGTPLLLFALTQNIDLQARELAIRTAGQLGVFEATRKLYEALHDRQAVVRDLAYEALGQIEQRTGQPLPSPV